MRPVAMPPAPRVGLVRQVRRGVALALATALITCGAACSAADPTTGDTPAIGDITNRGDIRPLPSSPVIDYQLGGPYPPAPGVTVVVRDRSASTVGVDYPVCYVNGFQTQPGERANWPRDLVLHDAAGRPVADPDWPDEFLLDLRTAEQRERVAEVAGAAVQECAERGFVAVEFDNLDSFTRSQGLLSSREAVALARLLLTQAHDAGLAAAQKNAPELAPPLREAGYDFALVEECAQFDECAVLAETYGDAVIDVEYTDAQEVPFAEFCAARERPHGVVLRDRDVLPQGAAGHVARWCP